MALIKCKECEKEISSDAVNCPGCGAPVKPIKKKGVILNYLKKMVITWVVIMAVFYAGFLYIKNAFQEKAAAVKVEKAEKARLEEIEHKKTFDLKRAMEAARRRIAGKRREKAEKEMKTFMALPLTEKKSVTLSKNIKAVETLLRCINKSDRAKGGKDVLIMLAKDGEHFSFPTHEKVKSQDVINYRLRIRDDWVAVLTYGEKGRNPGGVTKRSFTRSSASYSWYWVDKMAGNMSILFQKNDFKINRVTRVLKTRGPCFFSSLRCESPSGETFYPSRERPKEVERGRDPFFRECFNTNDDNEKKNFIKQINGHLWDYHTQKYEEKKDIKIDVGVKF